MQGQRKGVFIHAANTVIQGAGYRSTPRGRFDPLNQAGSGGTSPLDAKLQPSPEEQCLEAEAKVHVALEQSAEAHVKGNASGGQPQEVHNLAKYAC